MRQINVPIEDAVYEAAKIAAAKKGMLFKRWVEKAISDACDAPNKPEAEVKETHYEPFEG